MPSERPNRCLAETDERVTALRPEARLDERCGNKRDASRALGGLVRPDHSSSQG